MKKTLFLLFYSKSQIKIKNLLTEIIQFWVHEYGGLLGRALAELSISTDE